LRTEADLELDLCAWPLSTPEEEVREIVRNRARRIRMRRRTPVAAMAVAVAAVALATSLPRSGDATGLRTADEGGPEPALSEQREVQGPAGSKASASAEVWSGAPGARVRGGAGVGQTRAEAGVDHGVPATTRLTAHPQLLDPAGDADGPESLPVTYRSYDAADILSADFRLNGDTVEAAIQIHDLDGLDEIDHRGEPVRFTYGIEGVVHGDLQINLRLSAEADAITEVSGYVRLLSGVSNTSTTTVDFPVQVAAVDRTGHRVRIGAALAEINRALQHENLTSRRALGDISVRPGTRMTQLRALTWGPTEDRVISFQHDEARSKPGEYWAIGD
jgi:hypothetical protein